MDYSMYMDKDEIKKVMSYLGKLSAKKSKRTKKDYKAMALKRWAKHNKKNADNK